MKDDYVAETTTIRLIEASLGREDVADRANFRYMFSSSQPNFYFSFVCWFVESFISS